MEKTKSKWNAGSRPVNLKGLEQDVKDAILSVPILEDRNFSEAVRILIKKGLDSVGFKKEE